MKKAYLTFLLLIFGLLSQAQNISVKDFYYAENDLTARTYGTSVEDQNGNLCALIKVRTTERGMWTFDVGMLGVKEIETQNEKHSAEIWVYVPFGVTRMTIQHDKLGILDKWPFPCSIEKGCTYVMELVTGKVTVVVEETAHEGYLLFQLDPPDAVLEVNDQMWPVSATGTAKKLMDFGNYTYRVQALNYHPEVGKVTVDSDETKKVPVTLKPNFGWVEVTGDNALQGAAVYVDNALIGKVPCKSEALKSGQHSVRIVKEMYEPFAVTVMVSDNETTKISPNLTADFARVTLRVDADAEIWVNDERKGVRTWTGDLGSGTYKMECRQANHETTAVKKEITDQMNGQEIILEAPRPIYGSLVVESDPDEVTLYIDGKVMGETPKLIKEILIGQHDIKLSKNGYADYAETITITKGERKQVTTTLNKQKEKQQSIATNITSNAEQTFTVNGVSFTMKFVEGGSFQMGSNGVNAGSDEKPTHTVTLGSYYLGETEVTQALWIAVVGNNPSSWKGDNLPVENVSWSDAQGFIHKLSQETGMRFRLPTEAEWEYAARGGKEGHGSNYAGGKLVGNVAWFTDNSNGKTHEVKTKNANELGLYDMSGNVWEWCQDYYGKDYYGKSSSMNPQGPSTGSYRVLRGGSWRNYAGNCRVSIREHEDSYMGRNNRIGFRLCLPMTDGISEDNNGKSPIQQISTTIPEDALPEKFSISHTEQVYFSKGNLQYQVSTNTWKFAENQWDYIGGANKNISTTNSGWIDLFGWGSGDNPTNTSINRNDYSVFNDWGNRMGNGWRTLTQKEWKYVFDNRRTSSGIRYAKATVNGVNGVILLPDGWNKTNYNLSNTNQGDASYTSNNISSSSWNTSFAPYGAVFLPAAGYRWGTSLGNVGSCGYYWSASYLDSYYAYSVYFGSGYFLPSHFENRFCGLSVRLVAPAE